MSGRRLRAIGLGIVMAAGAALLPYAAAAGPPTLKVNFSISGGYRYTGTLATSAQLRSTRHNSDYACALLRSLDSSAQYAVEFNTKVFEYLILTSNAFDLFVKNYKPRQTTATNPQDVELDLAVNGRWMSHIAGASSGSAFRVTVHLASDGRSGTFVASHLLAKVPTTKSRSLLSGKYRNAPPVDVRGSWQCASFQTINTGY